MFGDLNTPADQETLLATCKTIEGDWETAESLISPIMQADYPMDLVMPVLTHCHLMTFNAVTGALQLYSHKVETGQDVSLYKKKLSSAKI